MLTNPQATDLTPFAQVQTAEALMAQTCPVDSHENSTEQGIRAVQQEMSRRNNPFYVIGMWIGRLIGTRQEDFSPVVPEPLDEDLSLRLEQLSLSDVAPVEKQINMLTQELSALTLDVEKDKEISTPMPHEDTSIEQKKMDNHQFFGQCVWNTIGYPDPAMKLVDQACRLIDYTQTSYVNAPVFVSFAPSASDKVKAMTIKSLDDFQHYSGFKYSLRSPEGLLSYILPYSGVTIHERELYGVGIARTQIPSLSSLGGILTSSKYVVAIEPKYSEIAPEGYVYFTMSHEFGHLFLGGLHPHDLKSFLKKNSFFNKYKALLDFVEEHGIDRVIDSPDLTRMSFDQFGSYLSHGLQYYEDVAWWTPVMNFLAPKRTPYNGLKYCETVNAITRYGQNSSQVGQQVIHTLSQDPEDSRTLTNQGGEGIIDARSLPYAATIHLEAGFCPTLTQGAIFYNAYQSDMTAVYTSAHADHIHLNHLDNRIIIQAGQGKTLHVYPENGHNHIEGFTPGLDKVKIKGFNLYQFSDLEFIESKEGSLVLPLGNKTFLNFYNHKKEDFSGKDFIFEHSRRDPLRCKDIPYKPDRVLDMPFTWPTLALLAATGAVTAHVATKKLCHK